MRFNYAKHARHARRRGFTLIELLVAITILAVVAVLGWRGLDGIVRARVALNRDLEQTRGMQLALAQLQSDCAQIVTTANIGGRLPIAAEPNRLTLVRNVYADNQPTRIQVVAYRVIDGVLQRRESAATRDLGELDQYWQAIASDREKNRSVDLQTGVASMAIRTWVAGSTGWNTTGDGAVSPPILGGQPAAFKGLEVALRLNGINGDLIKVFLLGPA
jgi:general secretion pathway protein J